MYLHGFELIPKATEDTITSLLAEELRKRGVVTESFPGLTTPVGHRTPDLLCKNAGDYPVEAKFSEADLIQAIAKVQNDYIKHHKVLGIKGGFALLYPVELSKPMPPSVVMDLAHRLKFRLIAMFPPGDPRPFRDDEGTLEEIVQKLAEYILVPTKPVEASIDFIIKSLRESALYILNGLKHLAGSDLEGFFGGRGVFDNILQYEEKKYPIEELRSAAAYILVNQLLFYHILSRLRPEFEEIDPDKIERSSDLSKYFSKVLEVNYRPIFFYDVASQIPEKFLEEVKVVINVIEGLSVEKVGGDLLGTIFHDLIPFETRKNVGAYYTNVQAAELLASLSIDDPDAHVADLAVGSGGLLVAAYRRKRELLKEPFSEAIHRRFVGVELLGVDVMPFAASVAACHLALQSPQYFTNRVKIAIWDSTDLKPGRIIPSAAGLRKMLEGQTYLDSFLPVAERRVKGAVEVGEGEAYNIGLNPCDIVIMNPPFTRHERIPTDYKRILQDRLKDYDNYIHDRLGYHGYFILLADRFLKKGGKMALVLPATVLRLTSCQGLREFLVNNYQIEFIVTTTQRAAFSESAQFREILLVATKVKGIQDRGELEDTLNCVVINLKRLPKDMDDAKSIANKIKSMSRQKAVYEDKDMMVKVVTQRKLRENVNNLFKLLPAAIEIDEAWAEFRERCETKLTTMQEYLEKINGSSIRGVQVWKGDIVFAPDMFILKDEKRALKSYDRWFVKKRGKQDIIAENRFTRATVKVPKEALARGFRRLSRISMLNVTEELDYVVVKQFEDMEKFVPKKEVLKYLPTWRDYATKRLCHLAIAGRYDISAPGTHFLAFFSEKEMIPSQMLWCVRSLSIDDAKIMALWMNSTIGLLQIMKERKETRGPFIQLLDSAMKKLWILNPKALSAKERRILVKTFDKIQNVEFPSILQQLKTTFSIRREIDNAVLKVLGFRKEEAERILKALYSDLAKEISNLKQILTGK